MAPADVDQYRGTPEYRTFQRASGNYYRESTQPGAEAFGKTTLRDLSNWALLDTSNTFKGGIPPEDRSVVTASLLQEVQIIHFAATDWAVRLSFARGTIGGQEHNAWRKIFEGDLATAMSKRYSTTEAAIRRAVDEYQHAYSKVANGTDSNLLVDFGSLMLRRASMDGHHLVLLMTACNTFSIACEATIKGVRGELRLA
jgi:hypothetical protein